VTTAALIAAWATAVVSGLAGVGGAIAWWQVRQSRAFWLLVRGAQGVAVVQALVAGVLAVLSFDPDSGLYWLYALLPVGIGFFAEQLRIVSTEQVLDRLDLEGAEAVRDLPEERQRSVVVAILRREMGVMTLAALVTCFLAIRAIETL
jgi:Ni/Fe-hydrogenase subunit HybB-like protein